MGPHGLLAKPLSNTQSRSWNPGQPDTVCRPLKFGGGPALTGPVAVKSVSPPPPPTPADDEEPLHRCFQPRALSEFAVPFDFHLLNGIKLDIYWPQTISVFL